LLLRGTAAADRDRGSSAKVEYLSGCITNFKVSTFYSDRPVILDCNFCLFTHIACPVTKNYSYFNILQKQPYQYLPRILRDQFPHSLITIGSLELRAFFTKLATMPKLIFLGGMGRSGTNLLRNVLDCHSDVASGPEFNHLQEIIEVHRAMASSIHSGRISSYVTREELSALTKQYISGLIGNYATQRGKSWVLEKTPSNIWNFADLAYLFPKAKFIQIVRDGRDVCCSHREVGKRFLLRGEKLHPKKDSALLSVFYCAALWTQTVLHGKRLCADPQLTGRIMTVRYEELVSKPESIIREVCAFLGLEFEESMLHPECSSHDTYVDELWVQKHEVRSPISNRSVGSWRTAMTLEERILFSVNGQEGLTALGYQIPQTWCFEGLTIDADTARGIINSTRKKIEQLKILDDMGGNGLERLSSQIDKTLAENRGESPDPSYRISPDESSSRSITKK